MGISMPRKGRRRMVGRIATYEQAAREDELKELERELRRERRRKRQQCTDVSEQTTERASHGERPGDEPDIGK